MPRFRLFLQTTAVISLFAIQQSVLPKITFPDEMFESVSARYGNKAEQRVREWQALLLKLENATTDKKLYEVNRFFNQVDFVEDIVQWHVEDYWATPIELLGNFAGDCEDYTIAKYFSLRALNIPENKLRFMYVTATRPRQAHMVLAYYETSDAIPMVLDNLNKRILPASQRQDLIPVYSFNGDGLWLAKSQGRGRQMQGQNNNSLWEDLNARMKKGY